MKNAIRVAASPYSSSGLCYRRLTSHDASEGKSQNDNSQSISSGDDAPQHLVPKWCSNRKLNERGLSLSARENDEGKALNRSFVDGHVAERTYFSLQK